MSTVRPCTEAGWLVNLPSATRKQCLVYDPVSSLAVTLTMWQISNGRLFYCHRSSGSGGGQ
jgi:hypothetical protein